jgi:hypothetical protein
MAMPPCVTAHTALLDPVKRDHPCVSTQLKSKQRHGRSWTAQRRHMRSTQLLRARPRVAPQGSRGHNFLVYDRITARPLSAALFGPSVCCAQPGASPGEARAAQHAVSCCCKPHTPSRVPPEHELSCTGPAAKRAPLCLGPAAARSTQNLPAPGIGKPARRRRAAHAEVQPSGVPPQPGSAAVRHGGGGHQARRQQRLQHFQEARREARIGEICCLPARAAGAVWMPQLARV